MVFCWDSLYFNQIVLCAYFELVNKDSSNKNDCCVCFFLRCLYDVERIFQIAGTYHIKK